MNHEKKEQPKYEIVGKCQDGVTRNIFKDDKTYVRKSMAERMCLEMQEIVDEELFVREVICNDPKLLNNEFFLKIVRDWKHSLMNQRQNDEADFQNYYNRAFGIDSNMMHSLANRLSDAVNGDDK